MARRLFNLCPPVEPVDFDALDQVIEIFELVAYALARFKAESMRVNQFPGSRSQVDSGNRRREADVKGAERNLSASARGALRTRPTNRCNSHPPHLQKTELHPGFWMIPTFALTLRERVSWR